MKEYGKKVAERLRKDVREFGMVWILIVVYVAVLSAVWGTSCPIRLFTGLPCPGCGITRAAALLLTGRWRQAWQMNPVIFPIALAVLYYGMKRYLWGRKTRGIKWVIAGIAVMLLAVYIVRMGRYFPGREPCSYLRGNFLEKILPAYRKILQISQN